MKRALVFLLLLILFSCKSEKKQQAGICISFDDRSVKEWYNMKGLLKEHHAKVTFFVTQFDSLDAEEIDMLKQLEKEGHEIGNHGAMHINSRDLLLSHSYKDYLKNEVDASISSMRKAGFDPKSFAYPFGVKFLFTDYLLSKRFKKLRGIAGIPSGRDITLMDKIYYDFTNDGTVYALGIDQDSGLTTEMIQAAIKRAKDRKEVLLLYGHTPVNGPGNIPYTFDINLLKFILTEAGKNNLRYFKMSELVH